MQSKLKLLLCSFVIMTNVAYTLCVFCKFSNVQCESYNKSKIEIKHCFIKAVSRDDNYMSVYGRIKETVKSCTVSIRLLKRANGWKPFLYNIKFDACKFLKNPSAQPLANFFYGVFYKFSNFNHTCPYTEDVFLKEFRILEKNVRLPFPTGEYAVDTTWNVNNEDWARVNGSCFLN